jgi:hypothetical protein
MADEATKRSQAHTRYPNIAPFVEAALPASDAEPLSARKIFDKAIFGSLGTARLILSEFTRDGIAVAEDAPGIGRRPMMRVYRRAG